MYRGVLVLIAGAMFNRAHWLDSRRFIADGYTVQAPGFIVGLFMIGAVVAVLGWLFPGHWTTNISLTVTMAIIIPYWIYAWWAIATFPWVQIRGTIIDLLLIPCLVAATFGKLGRRGVEL